MGNGVVECIVVHSVEPKSSALQAFASPQQSLVMVRRPHRPEANPSHGRSSFSQRRMKGRDPRPLFGELTEAFRSLWRSVVTRECVLLQEISLSMPALERIEISQRIFTSSQIGIRLAIAIQSHEIVTQECRGLLTETAHSRVARCLDNGPELCFPPGGNGCLPNAKGGIRGEVLEPNTAEECASSRGEEHARRSARMAQPAQAISELDLKLELNLDRAFSKAKLVRQAKQIVGALTLVPPVQGTRRNRRVDLELPDIKAVLEANLFQDPMHSHWIFTEPHHPTQI